MGFLLFHDTGAEGKKVEVYIDPVTVERVRDSFTNPGKCEVAQTTGSTTWVAMTAKAFIARILPYVNCLEHEECNESSDFSVPMISHEHIGVNDPCREKIAREAYTRAKASLSREGCQGVQGHSSYQGCCRGDTGVAGLVSQQEVEAPVCEGTSSVEQMPPGSVQP
jgi:hypothetical protein